MKRWAAAAVMVLGLVVLVTLRVTMIHASLDQILNWEEPYRLTIAQALLDGPRWPVADYQADSYQGGSLVMGMLAAPLVAVLGPSLETLKLVPLLFTLLTTIAWAVLLWRWVGPAAAALVVWLVALAPPMAQIYQVHAMGSHAESALFTVAGFLPTLALLQSGLAPSRVRMLSFLLGTVAGLGLWYCYSAASGIAAWILVWAVFSPPATVRRGLAPLVVGTIVGLLPWLAYNLGHGFQGFDRVLELFGPNVAELAPGRESLAQRTGALVAVDLVRALGFSEGSLGVPEWPAWIWYVATLLVFVALAVIAGSAVRTPRPVAFVAVLVVLAIAGHLAAYLVSSFRCDVENGFIAYRFFSPLFPLVAAGTAVVLTRPTSQSGRAVTLAGAVLLLGLGGFGTAELLRERPGRPFPAPRTADALMGQATLLKHRADPSRGLALIAALDETQREDVYFGFGWGLEYRYEKDGDWSAFVRALDAARSDERHVVLSGARWAVHTREQQVRGYANAGFLSAFSRELHARIVDLAARLRALDEPTVDG